MRIASRAELVEPREIRSGLADRVGGNAGELRDLQTVAAVGRPLRDFVQKHDAVLVLDRIEVDIGAAFQLRGQRGQLEVMRGEQRQAAIVQRERARDCPRQREAVEGRRAAADLVDHDQALGRRAMQNIGGFGHLDHERRTAAGKIVGRAHARIDRIERADLGASRRHE